MPERREPTVFDQTADLHAQMRPGYPDELSGIAERRHASVALIARRA